MAVVRRVEAAGAARAAWYVLALVGAGMYLAAVPAAYQELRSLNRVELVEVSALRAALEHTGWDATSFAAVSIALLLTYTAAAVSAAVVVFRRAGDDLGALLVATVLLCHGWGWPLVMDALGGRWVAYDAVGFLITSIGIVGLLLLPFVFPDGRFVPRWTRWVAVLMAGDLLLSSAGASPTSTLPDAIAAPTRAILLLAEIAVLCYAVLHRFRRVSTPEQRRQTRLVGAALLTILVCFLALGLVQSLLPDRGTPVVWVELTGTALLSIGFAVLPLAVAVAVLRHGLWGAPPVLRRALALTVVSAVALGIYAVIVVGVAAALGREGEAVGPAIAAAVVALLVEPLRRRAMSWVTRLSVGDRDDAGRAVLRLARIASEALDPEETVPALLRAVREAVRSPGAELVGSGVDATHGVVPANGCWEGPLSHHGQAVGILRVAPRSAGDAFDRQDHRLLTDVARSAALAVHAVRQHADLQRLADDLQTSRARLVAAREEERRRLRRDLHDTIGPTLAGQVLRLETTRDLVTRDPDRAVDLLDRAIAESETALSDVKRVVNGLRPPALDDAGLEQALRQRVAGLSGRVVVRPPCPPLPPLPAAVEVAAFHIASEAISNSLQHAPGATCWTGLSIDDDHLVVTVEDDGPGIASRDLSRRGNGLASMVERAAELGGTVHLGERATGGGTVVTVSLPLGDTGRGPHEGAGGG